MPQANIPVWFIADASAPLTVALAEAVLASGQRVVLVVPDPVDAGPAAALAARHPQHALLVPRNDGASGIEGAVAVAEQGFGRIDVLVTCAARRHAGAVEEGSEEDMRLLFEDNVFAPVRLARQLLPAMRARRGGRIVMLAAPLRHASAGDGFGQAARSALEALAEALCHEVERFGVKVTLVDPGAALQEPAASQAVPLPDYADLAHRRQAATPAAPDEIQRAAQAILRALDGDTVPLRLVLGRAALQRAYDRLRILKVGFDAWADLAAVADPPAPEPPAPRNGARGQASRPRGARPRAIA